VSAEAVLDGLFADSLKGGRAEGPVVELYTRRLLELERRSVYDYIRERDRAFLACLPGAATKANFVLELWRIAPAEHWAAWAAAMPGSYKGKEVADRAGRVVEHMLGTAPSLEPEAIRSIAEHLPAIRVALAALGRAGIERIERAARDTLEKNEWWSGEQAKEVQSALHELIRGVEAVVPTAADDLRRVRAEDLIRCPMEEPGEIKAMLPLAHELPAETYEEIEESLPDPDFEQRPLLYAETAVARVALQVRDPGRAGGTQIVAAHLRRIKRLTPPQKYRSQRRAVAADCLDLKPTAAQVGALSREVGWQPGPKALEALVRWSEAANRRSRADALSRLIGPLFDAADWAAALSQFEYVEAPVIRRLAEELLKDGTTVGERRRRASMVKGLRIRTQRARNDVADLIVALLESKSKNNLSVALVLCEGLGPEHQRDAKLKRGFERYARKHSHKYTPAEVQAIAAVGVGVPKKHLSKGSAKRSKELAAQGLRRVEGLAKFVGLRSSRD